MPPKKAQLSSSSASDESMPIVPGDFNAASKPREMKTTTLEQEPPRKMVAGITQAQKQALVDDLQLEITERARKLRAQYAEQAQALRSQLERRINRIPMALRKRTMQELLDEHAAKANTKIEAAAAASVPEQITRDEPTSKNTKRPSDQISTIEEDKENASSDLANPKKRVKTTTTTTNPSTTKTTTTAPRKETALSPKSHNSRTLPRSPLKPLPAPSATDKTTTQPSRATNPIKQPPMKTALPRPPTRQAAQTKKTSKAESGRSSEASTASADTTIVKKETAAKGRGAAAKKATTATARGAAAVKRVKAVVKKENIVPAGGRSLRKRG